MDVDRAMLDLAARCALRGSGVVEPNPMVGAVVARDGVVLGVGHHGVYGGLHAEREALASCERQGHDARGATLYSTLEPCCLVGKQPPCTEAIVRAGIARVVYAQADPHVKGRGGAEVLRSHGVAAELSDASAWARWVGAPFVKRVQTGLPWVIVKWAQTIDGRIATRTGESQWISNAGSRRRVHRLRARVDAIITGIGTVMADDPMLTARDVRRVRRSARRVVVDALLDLPLSSALVQTARAMPTTVACDKGMAVAHIALERREALEAAGVDVMGVPGRGADQIDLEKMLAALVAHYEATNVLIEAGSGLMGAILAADLADELRVYVAPMLLGDALARPAIGGHTAERLTDGRSFGLVRQKRIGDDVELTYIRLRESRGVPAASAVAR
ncbi:MAG: bifunctional diaminohydroxyphosphoribosylaminopyrimidine deaminase/5-amino-6-(5-phosphoribosylamino)uracil reductase RibD [Phycisphaeraceae bacterium]|nr:bifunctional diaminohydroxyphosphoribosylaminopyrimidine deaminase/5-amino-6-(5-phosphoribosylamino)uracil reductase RibD [Phycisphaeraceae bacterium]